MCVCVYSYIPNFTRIVDQQTRKLLEHVGVIVFFIGLR